MPTETLTELADSLTRERAVKGVVIVLVVLWLALQGGNVHPYLPIILFALLADLFSLNRQRRLVAAIQLETRQAARDADERDDRDVDE